MQAFCSMHNVPYNCFERHVRNRSKFKNIQPVVITGMPEEQEKDTDAAIVAQTNKYIKDRLDKVSDEEEGAKEDKERMVHNAYPMRGDMTSEQYIIRLLQTIESLDSTMRSMREETAFLREKLARMDASLEEKELERKRLWALMEAKDGDIRRLTGQIADLLGKVAALTKALEDKSHQLSSRNRGQFGTKTNRSYK